MFTTPSQLSLLHHCLSALSLLFSLPPLPFFLVITYYCLCLWVVLVVVFASFLHFSHPAPQLLSLRQPSVCSLYLWVNFYFISLLCSSDFANLWLLTQKPLSLHSYDENHLKYLLWLAWCSQSETVRGSSCWAQPCSLRSVLHYKKKLPWEGLLVPDFPFCISHWHGRALFVKESVEFPKYQLLNLYLILKDFSYPERRIKDILAKLGYSYLRNSYGFHSGESCWVFFPSVHYIITSLISVIGEFYLHLSISPMMPTCSVRPGFKEWRLIG